MDTDYRGVPPWPLQCRDTASLDSLRLGCSLHEMERNPLQAKGSQHLDSNLGESIRGASMSPTRTTFMNLT
jgi:hypothetical protein